MSLTSADDADMGKGESCIFFFLEENTIIGCQKKEKKFKEELEEYRN